MRISDWSSDVCSSDLGLLRKADRRHGHVLVPAAMFLLDAEAADRAEVSLDRSVEHLLELPPQRPRDQVQGLVLFRSTFDGVDRVGILEAAPQLLDQRALARADRTQQVKHLAALLALQRGGVKVTHDLGDLRFDSVEVVLEEIVGLDRLVAENPLDAAVFALGQVLYALLNDHIVESGVRQLSEARVLLDPRSEAHTSELQSLMRISYD